MGALQVLNRFLRSGGKYSGLDQDNASTDKYLNTYFADYLSGYELRCSDKKRRSLYELFQDIYDDDLWNILLTRSYTSFPSIKEFLPELPTDDLQRKWNGNSGVQLSLQSCAFYKKVKEVFAKQTGKHLNSAKILDFGLGWGRLIRYFAKDIPEDNLYGCDPDSNILDICKNLRVPGIIRLSDYRPKHLPFEVKFDLIYAYSVFTHLSERTHLECLQTLHEHLVPGGIIILTIRPRSFIEIKGIELRKVSDKAVADMVSAFDSGQFVFFPYNLTPIDNEITYGEAAIPYAYVKHHWTKLFDLIGPLFFQADPYQIPIALMKR